VLVVLPTIVLSACATTQELANLQDGVDRIEQKIDRLLGEEGPVSEAGAAQIATRLGDLRSVESITTGRVACTNTTTFEVRGSDAKGTLLIGVDAATGEVRTTALLLQPASTGPSAGLGGRTELFVG